MEAPDVRAFTRVFAERFEADDPNAAAKQLERARVDVVRAQFEALGRGDLTGFLELMDPEIELEIAAPPEFHWTRHARGLADVRSAVEHNFSTLEDQNPDLVSIVAQGNLVVIFGREKGRIRVTSKPYDVYFVYRFTFRGNKIQRVLEIAAFVTSET